ncbi:MAG: HEPN domain-containing protein [Microthrixaceae bacterium]|nr:HEPN domain-containing protein [Microthrixaceae bacterium]
MSGLAGARAHLAKAREFLDAAELNLEVDLYNAATSNSVISGINSKDATCLRLTGTTEKTENHSAAVAELKSAGADGPNQQTTKRMATNLGRLLKLKGKSQYQRTAGPPLQSARWHYRARPGGRASPRARWQP